MPDEPGKNKPLLAAKVQSFICPERPKSCVVKFDDGTTVIHAMVNDVRMLSILGVAAGTTKKVDIEYIESRPVTAGRRIDLLINVTLAL